LEVQSDVPVRSKGRRRLVAADDELMAVEIKTNRFALERIAHLDKLHDRIIREGSLESPTSNEQLYRIPRTAEDLFVHARFIQMRQFLRIIGVKAGSRVVNIGTGNKEVSLHIALAAETLGAHYVGYDFDDWEILNLMREQAPNLEAFAGSSTHRRIFMQDSTDSAKHPDRSQDFVLAISGAFSDPYSEPLSSDARTFIEALRVIRQPFSFPWRALTSILFV